MEADRTELNDLAAQHPERVRRHGARSTTPGRSAAA